MPSDWYRLLLLPAAEALPRAPEPRTEAQQGRHDELTVETCRNEARSLCSDLHNAGRSGSGATAHAVAFLTALGALAGRSAQSQGDFRHRQDYLFTHPHPRQRSDVWNCALELDSIRRTWGSDDVDARLFYGQGDDRDERHVLVLVHALHPGLRDLLLLGSGIRSST